MTMTMEAIQRWTRGDKRQHNYNRYRCDDDTFAAAAASALLLLLLPRATSCVCGPSYLDFTVFFLFDFLAKFFSSFFCYFFLIFFCCAV